VASETEHKKPGVQALSFGFYAAFLKKDKHCDSRVWQKLLRLPGGHFNGIAAGQVVRLKRIKKIINLMVMLYCLNEGKFYLFH